jgi:hypothetical protein
MLGPFRNLEELVGPSVLTMGVPCSVFLLVCVLKFAAEFVSHFQFVSTIFFLLLS